MSFNSRYFFTSIIAFCSSCVSVFNTLGIDNTKASFYLTPMGGTSQTNDFFLVPVLGYLAGYSFSHSRSGSNYELFSIWGNQRVTFAIGNHSLRHKVRRKILHTNPVVLALSFFWLLPRVNEYFQTGCDLCRWGRFFSYNSMIPYP